MGERITFCMRALNISNLFAKDFQSGAGKKGRWRVMARF
jgi:hypothetical protein